MRTIIKLILTSAGVSDVTNVTGSKHLYASMAIESFVNSVESECRKYRQVVWHTEICTNTMHIAKLL